MTAMMQRLVIVLTLVVMICGPVLSSAAPIPHQDAREFIPSLIRDAAKSLDGELGDQPSFITQVDEYKTAVDQELTNLLGDLALMVRNYAEHKGGLEGATQQWMDDINQFSVKFSAVADGFPRLSLVQEIIKPQMERLTAVLASEFPLMGPMPAQGFPLGHWYTFYQESERRNSLGMGPFFRIEPLKPQTVRRTFVSRINYVNDGGVEREEVIYEESQTFVNNQSVEHRIVRNGDVMLDDQRTEDFSMLHGLPAAMRSDGVNERFIRIVEEYVKLVNYYLIENYRERGLSIPIQHPQLRVPAGYTPDMFVTNFIALILAIQQPGPST